ncbi:DMT family transporter [Pseudomonas sp. 2FG]|uniref:DMT family transporter n=1 Tax=Pseudomonas sp. 2FG TaxID=2502191 RepID=UPI0010F7C569|nr:DMT family transporter [Pseudomonas sp. 2FG]
MHSISLEQRQGILLLLLAYFVYACGDAAAKWLVANISVWQILAMRSLFGLTYGLALGRRATLARLGDAGVQWRLLPMNLCNLAGWACFYSAASGLDLTQLYSLYYLTPLISTLLAGPMLGERVAPLAWFSCALGLVGVLLAGPPLASLPALQVLLPGLLTPLFWALTAVLYRRNVASHSDAQLMASNNLLMLLVCALLLPWVWQPLRVSDWLLLLLLGVLGATANLLYIMAIRRLPLPLASPISFSSLLWSLLLGYLIWDAWPSWNLWLGAGLVLTAAVLSLLGSRRQARA